MIDELMEKGKITTEDRSTLVGSVIDETEKVRVRFEEKTQEVKEAQNQNIKVDFDVSHITIDENDQTEHEKFLKLLSKKSKQEINW